MASNGDGGGFVAGFLLGGMVGAVIGMLLAPKPGSQTRAELFEQGEAWRERAEELAARVRERVGPTVETMRERVGPTVEGVRERVAPAVSGSGLGRWLGVWPHAWGAGPRRLRATAGRLPRPPMTKRGVQKPRLRRRRLAASAGSCSERGSYVEARPHWGRTLRGYEPNTLSIETWPWTPLSASATIASSRWPSRSTRNM